MTSEKFFTPQSSPEPPCSASPATEVPAAAAQRDALEIVVKRRLDQDDGDGEGGGGRMTIFRVPAHVREASKDLYEPRLVSVGPYHRGREALRAMEQHKWRLLRELEARRPDVASLADYVTAVRAVEQRARGCYSERTNIFDAAQVRGGGDHGAAEFAEMLLIDGCFIIEFFIKWHNRMPDELCDVGWGLNLVHSDLLLMENQIPFFVLEELFHVVAPEADGSLDLRRLFLPHLNLPDFTFVREVSDEMVPTREVRHMLHLFYEAFVSRPVENDMAARARVRLQQDDQDSLRVAPPQCVARLREAGVRLRAAACKRFVSVRSVPCWTPLTSLAILLREAAARFGKLTSLHRYSDQSATPPRPTLLGVPSVTQLRGAGVRFERAPSPRHMLDVTFDAATGVVRMPRVELGHANKPLLVNLVAFEQTTSDGLAAARPLSSYAALMASLVKTGRDVEVLHTGEASSTTSSTATRTPPKLSSRSWGIAAPWSTRTTSSATCSRS